MNDNDPFQGENLEEGARKTNSNLQRLIEAVGGLLAVSGDLLGRLQQNLERFPAPKRRQQRIGRARNAAADGSPRLLKAEA